MKEEKDIIEDMKFIYKSYRRTDRCSYRKSLLFPIDHYSCEVAKILCLNNYEISQLQYKYLDYWIKQPTNIFITASHLFNLMDIKYLDICKFYFSIYNEQVTFDIFLQFLCFFIFGTNERMAKIYLSICGIQTNMAVNIDQVLIFIKSFNENASQSLYVQQLLNSHPNGVTLPEIVLLLETLPEITVPLTKLKKGLIKNVLDISNYWNISQRRNMFDNNSFNRNFKYSESCTNKLYRIFILKRPPIYHTEYRDINEIYDTNKTIEALLLKVRERYGYSRRKVNSTPILSGCRVSPALSKTFYKFNCRDDPSEVKETISRVDTLNVEMKPVRNSTDDPLIFCSELTSYRNSNKRSSTVFPSQN